MKNSLVKLQKYFTTTNGEPKREMRRTWIIDMLKDSQQSYSVASLNDVTKCPV